MVSIKLWWLFCICVVKITASTHWMVTESGLIQPRLESPFEIENPYDLLAFLNQDTRWDNIINLYHDLFRRQQLIKSLWAKLEKDTDITTLMDDNEHCLKVGQLNLIDWYTSSLEEGKSKLGSEEYNMIYDANHDDRNVPDCKRISSLTFSMCAFEHLQSMKQRENLSAEPELLFPEKLSAWSSDLTDMSFDQFGSWLSGMLRKNTSSWMHYNMASLYWRVGGNALKAMECSRRAVHYAPREFKDIALLSMGLILHRSKMTEDAIIVLGAAVDHDEHCPINHFIVANSFAVLGDFNSSIKHYEKCLKLNPSFELAQKHRDGVMCHVYVVQRMQIVQDLLSKLREELAEYSKRETHWLKSQAALIRTMKQPEGYDYKDAGKNFEKLSQMTNLNMKELKKEGDKYSLIQYFLDGPTYKDDWLKQKGVHSIESANSLQRLVKHIGRHANMITDMITNGDIFHPSETDGKILKEIGPTPTFSDVFPELNKENIPIEIKEKKVDAQKVIDKKTTAVTEDDISEFDTGIVLYPPKLKISRITEDFDRDPEWPSIRLCKETAPSLPSNLEAIYQVFLPFENKGIRLKTLLTDKIGVPSHVEHELPWHPPNCPYDKDAASFTQKKSQKAQFVSSVIVTDGLRQKLLEYVGNGDVSSVKHMQDAEIGQRIYAAMQMKVAPKWLLYTLASLYWRVRGNNVNALHCVLSASKSVDTRFKDIVLVSLASIYLEMGYFDEALTAAEEAFKLSLYEPATNFLLSELNMIKKHRNTHVFHMKQVLRVDPNFMGGVAKSLLLGWSCLFKQVTTMHELDFGDGDICTQVEPGMNMVCDKDGTNCRLTNVKCYSERSDEGSTLIRLLDLNDEHGDGSKSTKDIISLNTFDQFIENMPSDRTDKISHQQNYYALIRLVDKTLRGCGTKGCTSKDSLCSTFCIKPEDLVLNEEDCANQHLELGYWLHITSFREILTDSDKKLPAEIMAMTPSNKKIPECRLPSNPSEDFFLERMMRVDTEDWEPTLSLMHQFAEMLNFYDYLTLGAKIARFVDTRGSEWASLAVAGWWCGAGGRGACAVRCLAAAHAAAPAHLAVLPARALAALLHIQSKQQDAMEIAYLSFYIQPKSKINAFLVGVSHTYLAEYEAAVWMYRYALAFDEKFLPAKACLHSTMCLMLFGDSTKTKDN